MVSLSELVALARLGRKYALHMQHEHNVVEWIGALPTEAEIARAAVADANKSHLKFHADGDFNEAYQEPGE